MSKFIGFLLLFFSAYGMADCPSVVPEETLACFFNAVDNQDEQGIAKVLLNFSTYHFNLTEKPQREIYKKITLQKDLVAPMPNGEVPIWAHKGNKEIWVKECYLNWSDMVSFFLNKQQGKWYIAGYSSHNQPE